MSYSAELPDGRLLRTYRQGKAKLPAYLEDYSFLVQGLLRLHHATGDPRWLREAQALTDRMLADFEDREQGGFFFTANDHESLLARAKDAFDNALPSGNSIAILDLLELHQATGKPHYLQHAGKALEAFSPSLAQVPAALPLALVGLEQYLDAQPAPSSPKLLAEAAPGEQTRKEVVAGSGRLAAAAPAALAAGSELEAIVTVTIDDGWHIYANPTGVREMKPTTLGLDRSIPAVGPPAQGFLPARRGKKVLGSLGDEKVSLYEGKVELKARLRLAEDVKPGKLELKLRLSYQACDDRLCRAPAKLEIPLSVSVGR